MSKKRFRKVVEYNYGTLATPLLLFAALFLIFGVGNSLWNHKIHYFSLGIGTLFLIGITLNFLISREIHWEEVK